MRALPAARSIRALRREIMSANGWSLRELYKTLETPGANKLRDAQDALDTAVCAAYGMKPSEDILAFLLKMESGAGRSGNERRNHHAARLAGVCAQPVEFHEPRLCDCYISRGSRNDSDLQTKPFHRRNPWYSNPWQR